MILNTYSPATSVVTVAATLLPPYLAADSIAKIALKKKGMIQANVWIMLGVSNAKRSRL
jgi:uncharacterized membrane protein YobD (UPF0266 family)